MIERIPDMQSRSTAGAGNSATSTDRKAMLSTLWIFAILNYIYADVFTAMDPSPESRHTRWIAPTDMDETNGSMDSGQLVMSAFDHPRGELDELFRGKRSGAEAAPITVATV